MTGKFCLLSQVHETITDVVVARMNQATSEAGKCMAFIECRRASITKGGKIKDSTTKAHAESITELSGRENQAVGVGGKNLKPMACVRSTPKDTGMERIVIINTIQDGLKTHL